MKTKFLSEDVWDVISNLATKAKCCQAAVAYIGSDALEMLPLGRGDTLVVDLSDGPVKSGSTNPAIIRSYFEKGVRVFSYPGLHAKVFIFDGTAVIGSTNVSINSRDVLTEAALATSDPGIVESCRQFIEGRLQNLEPLSSQQIAERESKYRKPRWTPGRGLPTQQTSSDWAYEVIKASGIPLSHKKRHGHFMNLSAYSQAVATAYLALEPADIGSGTARLDLYPADIVKQARSFYSKAEVPRLVALTASGWIVKPNLHFGNSYGMGLHPQVTHPSLRLLKYVEYWRANANAIGRFDQPGLRRQIQILRESKIVLPGSSTSGFADLKKYTNVDIRPGVRLTFQWPLPQELPSPASFAPKVRSKINQALQTWGDRLK